MPRLYAPVAVLEALEPVERPDIEMNVKPVLIVAKKVREIPMRIIAGVMAAGAIATTIMLPAPPARAQTYDPAYPICLEVYSIGGGYITCRYTSMDQCRLTASGRAALCFVNPYFGGGPGRSRSYRRPQ